MPNSMRSLFYVDLRIQYQSYARAPARIPATGIYKVRAQPKLSLGSLRAAVPTGRRPKLKDKTVVLVGEESIVINEGVLHFYTSSCLLGFFLTVATAVWNDHRTPPPVYPTSRA